MNCLNCGKELFKTGLALKDGTFCAGEYIDTKWIDGQEYIECRHCKANNFIENIGPHTFTIGSFTVSKSIT